MLKPQMKFYITKTRPELEFNPTNEVEIQEWIKEIQLLKDHAIFEFTFWTQGQ